MVNGKIFSLLQKLIEIRLKLLKPDGYVLMFHRVSDWSDEQNFWISTEYFNLLIQELKKKFIFCSVEEMQNNSIKAPKIIITFDDVYADCFKNAYPILKTEKIPFTIFVAGEYINKPDYLSTEMLYILSKDKLCTIGSHLEHHIVARGLTSEKLGKEIISNKKKIFELTGVNIELLAFPYGSYYAVSLKNIRVAKIYSKMIFLTWNSHYNWVWSNNNGIIPRVNINQKSARRYLDGHTFG